MYNMLHFQYSSLLIWTLFEFNQFSQSVSHVVIRSFPSVLLQLALVYVKWQKKNDISTACIFFAASSAIGHLLKVIGNGGMCKCVSLFVCLSTCSLHAYWTMQCTVPPMEMAHYLTSNSWMQGPCLPRNSSKSLCSVMIALSWHTQRQLETILIRFPKAPWLFDLTINLTKTESMHQPAPESSAALPSINIDNIQVKSVNHFKYLGSVISSDGTLNREIEA